MSIDIQINEKNATRVIERGITGAAWKILSWYGAAMLVVLAIGYAATKDDSTDGAERSNMRLHTDAMTGCQYLSAMGGGITPRMGANGKQICAEARP